MIMAASPDTAGVSSNSSARPTSSQGHRPKHMRWRDKVKYLEKEASARSLDSKQGIEKSVDSGASLSGGSRIASSGTERRRSASDAPPSFQLGGGTRWAESISGDQTYKAGQAMRWRDKVSFLEKEGSRRRSMTAVEQSPRPSGGNGGTESAIPEGNEHEVAGREDSKSKKTYSHTFTHHVPHTRLRDKIHILSAGSSNLRKEQVTS
mmetsp:Transcript_13606/g.24149  ORF Transcript_13606/g.24149 Transcript_13606/m.24149 type:complete len:207 (-) Transcript_13606:651-1271(-)